MRASGMLIVLFVSLFAARANAAPPTTKPTLGEQRSLASGLIQFNAPPDPWATPEIKPDAQSAVYTTHDRLGQMAVIVEPKDMTVVNDNVAVAIMKELRAKREKSGVKIILPPTIEKDSHFAAKIHEKYKLGDHVNDSLQLFREVGPRVVLVIVGSLADDADAVAQMHNTGQAVLLSAKYNRQAAK